MTHATPAARAVEPATPHDVSPLAALHRACLPASMISMLGARAVERYYAMVVGSPHERVLVVRAASEPGALVAACVLALEPHTVLRRFARHAPRALATDLARQAASSAFRRRVVARLREAVAPAPSFLEPTGDVAGVPEVTQIFTAAAQRGRGLGSALLRGCEALLRDLGHVTYCIHTLRDDNDAGIRFYRREGFTQSGAARSFGDHYLVMTKGLT